MTFFHSIRTRLTLWYTAILAVTLLGAGVTAYIITRATMIDNLDLSLRSEVTWVSAFIEPKAKKVRLKRAALRELEELKRAALADTTEERDETPAERAEIDEMWNQIYQHTLLSPRRQLIQILDRNGDLLYRSQSLRGHLIRYDDIPYQWVNVVSTNLPDGTAIRLALTQNEYVKVFVAYPLAPLEEVLDSVFANLIFILLGALLVSVIGGWFLAHKSLKPVDDLTRMAREITAENLSRRLPTLRADDELERLTAQFNDMIGRLQASFEQIRQFSADASHELRTPLTILRGEIEVALRTPRLSRSMRELLESFHQETLRLSSIVESLMTLVRSDAGRQVFRFAPVDLGLLLRRLVEDAERLAAPKKIRLEVGQIDEIPFQGDEARLRQLFLNLLENAVKYTPARGTVTVSLVREPHTALFTVLDTGIGIPPKDLDHIFERFYRVERTVGKEVPGGSGLGLAIAKWVAEAHKGTIEAKSREGRGSTFVVRLPIP